MCRKIELNIQAHKKVEENVDFQILTGFNTADNTDARNNDLQRMNQKYAQGPATTTHQDYIG